MVMLLEYWNEFLHTTHHLLRYNGPRLEYRHRTARVQLLVLGTACLSRITLDLLVRIPPLLTYEGTRRSIAGV
jgi:hypothetical protein